MGRIQIAIDGSKALVVAGTLGDVLRGHARQRGQFFFAFLRTLKLLEHLNNTRRPSKPIKAAEELTFIATHQAGVGYLSDNPAYGDFNKFDANVVNEWNYTKEMSAAHMCNLGVSPRLASRLEMTDESVKALYDYLEWVASRTQLLPKRINVGPEAVIDNIQKRLAAEILTRNQPVNGTAQIQAYISKATTEITRYIHTLEAAKGGVRAGVAACAKCYLEAYAAGSFASGIGGSALAEVQQWSRDLGDPVLSKLLLG